jgi:hypothetical protein
MLMKNKWLEWFLKFFSYYLVAREGFPLDLKLPTYQMCPKESASKAAGASNRTPDLARLIEIGLIFQFVLPHFYALNKATYQSLYKLLFLFYYLSHLHRKHIVRRKVTNDTYMVQILMLQLCNNWLIGWSWWGPPLISQFIYSHQHEGSCGFS